MAITEPNPLLRNVLRGGPAQGQQFQQVGGLPDVGEGITTHGGLPGGGITGGPAEAAIQPVPQTIADPTLNTGFTGGGMGGGNNNFINTIGGGGATGGPAEAAIQLVGGQLPDPTGGFTGGGLGGGPDNFINSGGGGGAQFTTTGQVEPDPIPGAQPPLITDPPPIGDQPPGGGLPGLPPAQPPPGTPGAGASMLPGQLFDRGEFQQSSDAILAGAFGQRAGIDDAQTQREVEQFEQDLTQRGQAGQKQLEARLQQMGILTSGITGQRGVDLQTALQQERGRFRTNTLGELERRRFQENLAQNQNLQQALGQRFQQSSQDIGQQQSIFQQNVQNQDRNTQMILSLLGLGGVDFPQGGLPGGARSPDRSMAGGAGSLIGTGLGALLGNPGLFGGGGG